MVFPPYLDFLLEIQNNWGKMQETQKIQEQQKSPMSVYFIDCTSNTASVGITNEVPLSKSRPSRPSMGPSMAFLNKSSTPSRPSSKPANHDDWEIVEIPKSEQIDNSIDYNQLLELVWEAISVSSPFAELFLGCAKNAIFDMISESYNYYCWVIENSESNSENYREKIKWLVNGKIKKMIFLFFTNEELLLKAIIGEQLYINTIDNFPVLQTSCSVYQLDHSLEAITSATKISIPKYSEIIGYIFSDKRLIFIRGSLREIISENPGLKETIKRALEKLSQSYGYVDSLQTTDIGKNFHYLYEEVIKM